MKKIQRIYALIVGWLLLMSTNTALAADEYDLKGKIVPRKSSGSILTFLNDIANILLSTIGALALLFIVIGGLQLVTSAGNPDKIKTAKKTLTYAIIGLLAVVLSKVIFGILTGSLLESVFFTK